MIIKATVCHRSNPKHLMQLLRVEINFSWLRDVFFFSFGISHSLFRYFMVYCDHLVEQPKYLVTLRWCIDTQKNVLRVWPRLFFQFIPHPSFTCTPAVSGTFASTPSVVGAPTSAVLWFDFLSRARRPKAAYLSHHTVLSVLSLA